MLGCGCNTTRRCEIGGARRPVTRRSGRLAVEVPVVLVLSAAWVRDALAAHVGETVSRQVGELVLARVEHVGGRGDLNYLAVICRVVARVRRHGHEAIE